jgi:hypothetical protein
MTFRQVLLRAVLAAAAVTLVFAGPSFGVRQATPSKHGILRDFASSGALQKPTAAQRAAVRALHAKATWNSYGTPSTLMRPGGFLTKQAAGKTAAIAARSWLAKHKVIFRLSSVQGLQLAADSKLSASSGHAVTFQQAFNGLKLVNGEGTVTVAISPATAHRWKIGFVSSTVIGTVPFKGAARISAAQAWVHASGNAGLKSAQLVNVQAVKVARGWVNLRVGGLPDIQRVRLGAFGLGHTAVPAYETIVVDRSTGTPAAYRVIVDARTGAALARANLVDYFGGKDASITAPVT